MKHQNRVDFVGIVKKVDVQRINSIRRVRLNVETEDLNKDTKIQLPITAWQCNNNNLDFPTIGASVHIVGRFRVKNQPKAYCIERTTRDVIARKVEIIDAR